MRNNVKTLMIPRIVLLVTALSCAGASASLFPPRNNISPISPPPPAPSFVFPKTDRGGTSPPKSDVSPAASPLAATSPDGDLLSSTEPRIALPGGGLFYYWQAGVISYLREAGYDLANARLCGASAGALVATLAGAGVVMEDATELALDLSERAGVWDRSGGLQGIWGAIIEEWLDTLLPDDAAERVSDRVSVLVTPVPSFGKARISRFESKEDLIRCNMASTHIPWFLDGKLTRNFRNAPHIDGSFFASPSDYFPLSDEVIRLDFKMDPVMNEKANDFVKLISKDGIWSLMERGREYGKIMDKRGDFRLLQK